MGIGIESSKTRPPPAPRPSQPGSLAGPGRCSGGSRHDHLPTELALWLVGLGVEPAYNPPRQPWLNPRVERLNGVTQRGVETASCPDHATLEERLAWACHLQREWYPAVAGQPRLQAHPELTRILRPYSEETEMILWESGRVDSYLAGQF
ncbi:MAG TPA: hypothetical protein VFT74_11100 [Isosphaeraceae bacterium]|nr:hypothetical protein [Isosphaeraceae bacterium]